VNLAVDIDGTLTVGDGSGAVDPRIFEPLRETDTVVVCTGKVLPNVVSLCRYVGIRANVVAENGGLTYTEATQRDDHYGEVRFHGDGEAAQEFAEDFRDGDLGWGKHDLINRWRETERAVALECAKRNEIEEVARRHGLVVLDTGYAYHVKSSDVDKGKGLLEVADSLGKDADDFVAVGDSENDVDLFEAAGTSYAVGNADESASEAADEVVEGEYADGFLDAYREASTHQR